MILQKYSFFLFLILIHFGHSIKQFVDLENNYDDFNADNIIIPDDESSSNITYICGENIKNDCECKNDQINCVFWFKDANVKPIDGTMEIREAVFSMSNITVLKRGRILPDNEDTVQQLKFRSAGVKFIEAGAFDKFISLDILWLHNNLLTTIDEKILTPQLGLKLKTLSLSNNNLTALNPMAFRNLKKLSGLALDSNPNLKELTDIFPGIDLEMLDLCFCGISFLQENVFKNLQKLRILRLNGNNLTSIPVTVKYLPILYQIELAHNLLTKIESNAFISNLKLSNIMLNDNPLLLFVDDCAFCGLPILEWVELNSCHQLSYIHENAFGTISTGIAPRLDLFMINECNLTILPEKLLDWKNTEELNIGGNPFACNCSMAWLFRDLLSDQSLYNKKIKRRYHGHKYILGCFPPIDTKHKHFLKPLNISEIMEPCKLENSSSNLFWLIFIFLAGGIIASTVLYVYRSKVNSIFVLHSVRFRNKRFMQMSE